MQHTTAVVWCCELHNQTTSRTQQHVYLVYNMCKPCCWLLCFCCTGEQLCSFTYVAAGLTAPLAAGVIVTEVCAARPFWCCLNSQSGVQVQQRDLFPAAARVANIESTQCIGWL